MKKTMISIALAASFAAPAFAEDADPAQTPAAAPAGPHTFTGNVGLFSSYRFRGIDQTFGQPALQGGFDYSHSSGFYAGNWNSNVNSGAGYPGGNLEMDFYGGYKTTFGDFGLDVGALYYYYPGTDVALAGGLLNPKTGKLKTSGKVDNKELYIAGSWKFLSLKYSYAIDDYFGVPDTNGTSYLDLSANYDLGDGWGINGHVGYLDFKNFKAASGKTGNYTDWKIGVTKDISGWVLGAAYVGTNAKGDCSGFPATSDFYCFGNSDNAANASKSKDAGRDIVVLSISKTF